MATDLLGTSGSAAGRIGRYFTVVSALPATVFAGYVYVLIKSGAWSGPIDWAAAVRVDLGGVAVLGVASFVLALTMNPLQFTLIQLFEGYWGASPPAEYLALARTAYHRRRRQKLYAQAQERASGAEPAPTLGPLRQQIRRDERLRAYGAYPKDARDILPTRLGNVLRRYETSVGRPYGLDLLATVPRLAMVGGEREIAYVTNQRVQLELALRTSFLALVASLVTLLFMSRHGVWLLLALVPYAIAYLAYRGAVAVAHEYAMSLAVLVDLGRFRLYQRVGLRHPADIDEERRTNRELMRLFHFRYNAEQVRYRAETDADRTDPGVPPEEQPDQSG